MTTTQQQNVFTRNSEPETGITTCTCAEDFRKMLARDPAGRNITQERRNETWMLATELCQVEALEDARKRLSKVARTSY